MKNDEFDKLFKYMEKRFEENNTQHEETRTMIRQLAESVDYVAGAYDTLTKEEAASAHAQIRISDQLNNHEDRIVKLEKQITA